MSGAIEMDKPFVKYMTELKVGKCYQIKATSKPFDFWPFPVDSPRTKMLPFIPPEQVFTVLEFNPEKLFKYKNNGYFYKVLWDNQIGQILVMDFDLWINIEEVC
jgi:hypothetical protein